MNKKTYQAIFDSPDKPLRIGTIEIPCYVIEKDGHPVRVLSGRDMQTSLGLGQAHGTKLKHFLNHKEIIPFINNELAMALENPIRFTCPGHGGKPALGYETTILTDICDAVLEARNNGAISGENLKVAKFCEILTRGFAKIGIIALVDEATGFQKIRDRDELNRILEAYIAKELLPWTKRFPDSFYKELFRLRGWQYSPLSVKRPKYVGKLTNQLIYEKLPDGVLDQLKKNPPKTPKGYRKHRFFQVLTNDIDNPHLEKQITSVITLMKAASNWKNFERLFQRAFRPGLPEQTAFNFVQDKD